MYGLEVSSLVGGLGIFLWVCRGGCFLVCENMAVPGDVVLTQALLSLWKIGLLD